MKNTTFLVFVIGLVLVPLIVLDFLNSPTTLDGPTLHDCIYSGSMTRSTGRMSKMFIQGVRSDGQRSYQWINVPPYITRPNMGDPVGYLSGGLCK